LFFSPKQTNNNNNNNNKLLTKPLNGSVFKKTTTDKRLADPARDIN